MGVDIQTYRAKIGTYRHNFGTDVATCVIVINFSQSLKYIGSVLFIGILLMMAGIEPNPGPKDCADDKFDKLKDNTTIKVTGLPENVTDETLVMFFENERRQGGGEVNAVSICERDGYALVTFKNKTAVETVLNKKPIIFLGQEIQVESYVPAKIALSNLEVSKLFVAWLPSNVTEETLTMFFENERRQGGGTVLKVTLNTENQTAVVEFENPEAVCTVLQKRPIIISGQEVKIDIFDPQKQQSPALEPSKLFVAGLPSNVTEETLTMFFENERKQGGGVVLNVTIDTENQTAVVEFENPKAVQTVLQKRPIIISRKEVQVDIFGLSCQNRQINDETKAKNSGIRRTSEGDTVQLGGVNELHTECVQISTHGQTIEPMAPNNEVPGLSLLAYERISNAMEVKNQETKNVGEESAERSRNENDTQNKCEEDHEDHQLLESVTMDHKAHERSNNAMEIQNLKIRNVSEESAERSRNENDIQTECEEDQDKHRLLESVTQHHKGMSSLNHQRNNYETKVKDAGKRKRIEGDKGQLSGETDVHTLSEQSSGQTIEHTAPDDKEVGTQPGGGTEQRESTNDTQILCEQGGGEDQSEKSVTSSMKAFHVQRLRSRLESSTFYKHSKRVHAVKYKLICTWNIAIQEKEKKKNSNSSVIS